MIARRFALSVLTLGVGYAVAGALFWALLNVPESSVAALALSAALALLIVAAAGGSTGGAISLGDNAVVREAGRRALVGLPGFIAGLIIFGILWWLTGSVDGWWRAHRGEVDAVFLRYLGTARTGPIHFIESWAMWLVRWVLGLSVIAGLVCAGVLGGAGAMFGGLRTSLRLAPLAAACVGALIVREGLWRLVYWRPKALPPTWLEPAFAVVKFLVLYALFVIIAALVLSVFRRAMLAVDRRV